MKAVIIDGESIAGLVENGVVAALSSMGVDLVNGGDVCLVLADMSLERVSFILNAPADTLSGRYEVVKGKLVPRQAEADMEDWTALVRQYDGHVQRRLDSVAASFGYGDPNRKDISPILHAISYAEERAVPKFQAEGQVLRAWRSLYWAACWPILEAVRLGRRPVPAPAVLLQELDQFAPPPTEADVNAKIVELSS